MTDYLAISVATNYLHVVIAALIICGEDCPDVSLCIECCSVEIKTNIVDMLEFNTYEEQDLDSDPVIFLQCGHFYSRTTLDGIMEIGESSLKIADIFQSITP